MNVINLRPLHDRVVVEVIQESQTTASGIYIPTQSDKKTLMGKVISVGTGRTIKESVQKPSVSPGDVVLFNKYAATNVDEEHMIIREDEILGVVEE